MAGPAQDIREYKVIAHQLHMPEKSVKTQEYPGF
jgi:hypothetical protein